MSDTTNPSALSPVALASVMKSLGEAALAAQPVLAAATREQKDAALLAGAIALRDNVERILAANAADMQAAEQKNLSAAMLDRLRLDAARVEAMARGLEDIARLPDPVGRVLAEWDRPNGLHISPVAVPLGVIGITYDSRPNLTAHARALCLKSGHALILRGGPVSAHTTSPH